jgi:pSer/pThr/pTyr-binding forkhead associated (FHA) protein
VIQLKIVGGKQAGTSWVARRFPVRIGRIQPSELQLEEPGVWDRHLAIEAVATKGFLLRTQPEALVRVNGEAVNESWLRNGDVIEFGSVRLQFWLAQAEQRGLRIGECLPWLAIVLMTIGQIALIYWLIR